MLGFAGGAVGLLWAYSVISYNAAGCSCNWDFVQSSLGWPVLYGSLIGIAGGAIYEIERRVSGALLLLGGILASPLLFVFEVGSWTDLPRVISFFLIFGVFLFPGFLAGFLLFLGGLLGFQRTRRIIRGLHDGGWIP